MNVYIGWYIAMTCESTNINPNLVMSIPDFLLVTTEEKFGSSLASKDKTSGELEGATVIAKMKGSYRY